ncbi:hypothetical protein V565_096080 [Rhizoctonia solani 123E]|uniref:HMG box domain-containing protein n=1 Tax=Rhizoctonia solani 123E TaxID=1423351 RepID=A0A074RRG0_9AGAM|nr:hypothetical protein V565_096080 [Rhizoctonia solani 123E]
MPKTCPFTRNTLLKYPDFVALPADLKTYALDLFDEGRLSVTGNFKRASNPFFVYRRERSMEITNEHKATRDSSTNGPSHIPQKEISLRIRDAWIALSTEERKVYALTATNADEELRREFPHYEYTPISDSWWAVLNTSGKRRFWFETMLRICNVQVHNSTWPGYLAIQRLAQLLSSDRPVATLRQATRGLASQSTSQSGPPRPHREASHPYNAARMPHQSKPATVPWYDQLMSELVYIGPQVPGGPERLLELLLPQPQGALVPVYIEAEVPLGVPSKVVDAIRMAESLVPGNAMVLRGYIKPKLASTLLPPPKLASQVLPNLSNSQQSTPAFSPPECSPVCSGSGVVTSHPPITPSQTEIANNAHDMSYWNSLWEHLEFDAHDQSKDTPLAPPGSTQLLLDPIPIVEPNPAGILLSVHSADVPVGDFYKSAPVNDNSVETDIDALLPWLPTLRPTESDETTLALISMLSCDPLSQEEHRLAIEHFGQTFQELTLPILE